ncbi:MULTISPECIES: phosphate ABC transporter permease subunit PstC [Kocuria]|uniref:Phosphate transport system permease protein n=1 Tax=Kocuria marina subsp. indica TaxID=1049583 RepID=A0A1X7DYC8_9MICC|nr:MULTISPECIES: phosphate ABC transporter permease subunit PstC [Kocuria]MBX7557622.1 phosphate ABC transporter permease subunit PstC [Streptomyces sp. tea 10]MBN6812656.1 phosphate ABC transporter permease subunit PstC [Kocuria indica]MBN6844326.1 phosphate ABC transporter permease subunit PstC [Kocuria indica]MCG7431864.1 phosphate ABC transporter permease subunit PstC [Kocuria indica]MCT1724179.1 phosphate ABC transporter permease subunit PstC [Kocuria marina]
MSTTISAQKPGTRQSSAGRAGDSVFSGLSLAAGILIFAVLAAVALFLLLQALPTFAAPAEEITGGQGFFHYIWPLIVGTLIAAVIALLIATPVGILVALYISHYAPAKISKPVGYVIDLLAAIPSVIYGAWGATVLAPALVPLYNWLTEHLGFIPIFDGPASQTGKTMLTAGIVLAIMILPIITSMSREIFTQTPKLHEEAALALGATRWEMIRMAVLPFARPGIISSIMLALGRALGETMAVALVLSSGPMIASLIKSGNQTIAAEIALNFPEAYGLRLSELIAAGLVLFLITLVVNMIARAIIARYKEFSGAN